MPNNAMISVQSLGELSQVIRQGRQAAETTPLAAQQHLLADLAVALRSAQDDILEANTLDLEASLEMAVPDLVVDWLRLTPDRLNTAITALERLHTLVDCASRLPAIHRGLTSPVTQVTWTPLGIVALIYEALPDLAIFAAGLCLYTGNGLLLKGGNEASQTNQVIAEVFQQVLAAADLSADLIQVVSTHEGESARRWLMQTPNLDLVIPYGRPSLIQQVCREAQSPVLAPAMGNCYLYWAPSGDIHTVATAVIDSYRGSPDPVNAVETVLIHAQVSDLAIATLQQQLEEAHLQVKVLTPEVVPPPVTDTPWQQPVLQRTIRLCPVPHLNAAIAWINRHSSGHSDGIVTNTYRDSQRFIQEVRSATIHVNVSPRFLRNPASAHSIALGMAAQRGVFRGRITLEALVVPKTIVSGL